MIPSSSVSPMDAHTQEGEERKKSHAHLTSLQGDCERNKRAAAVRWTSSSTSSPSLHEAHQRKPHESASGFTTAAPHSLDVTTSPHDGPLSLEKLLAESKQNLSELILYKRRCRIQAAALAASAERERLLESALGDARAELRRADEQHRAGVAATAEELQRLKAALAAGESALRVAADEAGGLRRESEWGRRAHEQAERDRAEWGRQRESMEKNTVRLVREKELLEREVVAWRTRCSELEKKNQSAEELTSNNNSSANNQERNNNDNNNNEAREAVRVLQEELDHQRAYMDAEKESMASFRENVRNTVNMIWKRLLTLRQRGVRVTSLLRLDNDNDDDNDDEQLHQMVKTKHEEEENVIDMGSIFTATNTLVQCIEQQWCNIEEEVVLAKQRESQKEKKESTEEENGEECRLQEKLNSTIEAHAIELERMKNESRAVTEQLHLMELRYSQLLRVLEQQSRMMVAATNADVRKCKGTKPSHANEDTLKKIKDASEEERENQDENVHDDSDDDDDHIGERRGESKTKRAKLLTSSTAAGGPHEYEMWYALSSKDALTCASILDPSHEQAVQVLLRRVYNSTRRLTQQLREARSKHESLLVKINDDRQRLSVAMSEERLRHQATVKRLQTSIKTASETTASLQAQMASAMRTAEAERHALVRRAETAESEVQAKSKQERQLQRQLREMKESCEVVKQEMAGQNQTIAKLNAELAAHQSAKREEQFDMNTLRHRCNDLVLMANVLETKVEREVQSQRILYELSRELCGLVAFLTLRLNTVAAERHALWRAYHAREEDCRAAIQVIREFVKEDKKEREDEEFSVEFQNIGKGLLCCRNGNSFYAVVSVVVACGRMQKLLSYRRSRRHVMFAVNTDGNSGSSHNNTNERKINFSSWRMLTSNNVLRLVESVPLVAAALSCQRDGTIIPLIELPPLKSFLAFLVTSHSRSNATGLNDAEEMQGDDSNDEEWKRRHKIYELEQILALAEFAKNNVETNRLLFEANVPQGGSHVKSAGKCGGIMQCLPPYGNSQRTTTSNLHGRHMFSEILRSFLHSTRDRFADLRKKIRCQDISIQCAEEENHQLKSMIQEREQLANGFAQKLYSYEQHVSTSFVHRDVYRQLQERLRVAYDSFQEEREVRRRTEEANAELRQREVELRRTLQHMRDEMRALSIELENQHPHESPPPPPPRQHNNNHVSVIHHTATESSAATSPYRSGVMNTSNVSNITQLYVPRSMRRVVTSSQSSLVNAASMNTSAVINNVDGDPVQRVILGLESRLEHM